MDNLTHSFCGAVLARAGLDRHGAWVMPTLVVAANLPDAETLLLEWMSRSSYLIHHRGNSHSLFGLALQAVLLAMVVRAIYWVRGREDAVRFPNAVAIAAIGLFSHLLLDWFNTYGVRPFLPFDPSWYYGDLAFVADPWMWLILGGAIFLGSRLQHYSRWIFATALTTIVVVESAVVGLVPPGTILVWLLGLAAVLGLRHWRGGSQGACAWARAGLAAFALYAAGLGLASHSAKVLALSAFERDGGVAAEAQVSVNPVPAVPWHYDVLADSNGIVDQYSVDLLRHQVDFRQKIASNLRDPALAQALGTPEYRAWSMFARHPLVEHEGNILLLGDARYRTYSDHDWSQMRVILPAQK